MYFSESEVCSVKLRTPCILYQILSALNSVYDNYALYKLLNDHLNCSGGKKSNMTSQKEK